MGNYIKLRREKMGLTQKKLGEKLNVDNKIISKWERGVSAPDISILKDLAIALDTTVVNILDGNDHQKSDADKTYLSAFNFYIKEHKKKLALVVVVFLMLFVFIGVGIHFYESYNNFFVYEIGTDDEDFGVGGYLILNTNKKMIFINGINYNDVYTGTVKELNPIKVEVSLMYGNEKICAEGISRMQDEELYFNDLLSGIKIDLNKYDSEAINSISKKDLDNLYLEINYLNEDGKDGTRIINLTFK